MAEPDYGADIACLPDLDPYFTMRSDRYIVAEAAARALQDYEGFDIRALLSEALSGAELAALGPRVRNAILRDERIAEAAVQLTWRAPTRTLTLHVSLDAGEGPFDLVMEATTAAVRLVQVD